MENQQVNLVYLMFYNIYFTAMIIHIRNFVSQSDRVNIKTIPGKGLSCISGAFQMINFKLHSS